MFIRNHYGEGVEVVEVVQGVFARMLPSEFCKSIELDKLPGIRADVYRTEYDGITWYVKFFRDDSGSQVRVRIWSCNWDHVLH